MATVPARCVERARPLTAQKINVQRDASAYLEAVRHRPEPASS